MLLHKFKAWADTYVHSRKLFDEMFDVQQVNILI